MITEAEFTAQVIELARLHGWRTLHLRPARTSKGWRTPVQGDGVGWPDLFLVRGDVAIAAELKVGRNRVTSDQQAWLDDLCHAGVMVFIWQPEHWDTIEYVLQHGKERS